MDRTDKLKVECHAAYRGEETPQRFYLGSRAVEVVDVLDRWLAPSHRYFKLRGSDGGIYILRHASDDDCWELTLFDSGSREQNRLSST